VIAKSLQRIGLLIFEFVGEPQLLEVHVYETDDFVGTVFETEGWFKEFRLQQEIGNVLDIPLSHCGWFGIVVVVLVTSTKYVESG